MIAIKLVAILVVASLAQVQAASPLDPRAKLTANFADFCKAASDKIIFNVEALKGDDDSHLFNRMLIQEKWDAQVDGAKSLDKYQTEESLRDALVHSCNRVKSYYADVEEMFEKAKKLLPYTAVPKDRVRLGHFDCVIVDRLKAQQVWCKKSLQAALTSLKQGQIKFN